MLCKFNTKVTQCHVRIRYGSVSHSSVNFYFNIFPNWKPITDMCRLIYAHIGLAYLQICMQDYFSFSELVLPSIFFLSELKNPSQ